MWCALWAMAVPFRSSAAGDAPVLLTDQHVDLRVVYDATSTNLLDIVVVDEDTHPARSLASTNCLLVASEAARLELPSDLPPLGNAGDPLWVLPASQQAGLLYLGISGEGVPGGVFAEPFHLQLLGLEGPGDVFLWQAELGGLEFHINTRDGIGPDDVFEQPAGGHSHADWGFATTGVYRVTFRAESRRVDETTNIFSPPRTFTFHVLPLPSEPVSPFRQWQQTHWPGVSDSTVVGEAADPDRDGQPNLWEYVLGTDPSVPDLAPIPVPALTFERQGELQRPVIQIVRDRAASDAGFRLWTAEQSTGPWSRSEVLPDIFAATDGWVVYRFGDPRPVAFRGGSFYRLEVMLEAQH